MLENLKEEDLVIEDMIETVEQYCCTHINNNCNKLCKVCILKALAKAGYRRTSKCAK